MHSNVFKYKNVIPLQTLRQEGQLVHYAAIEADLDDFGIQDKKYIFFQIYEGRSFVTIERWNAFSIISRHFEAYWAGNNAVRMNSVFHQLLYKAQVTILISDDKKTCQLLINPNHKLDSLLYDEKEVNEILHEIRVREMSSYIE